MKKIAVLLLAVLTVVSLASCGFLFGIFSSDADDLDNTNIASISGLVARSGNYTYFVQQRGLNNDGSGNGTAYSADIYRISDDETAKPEKVISVPSYIYDGIQQSTVFELMPCGDSVYFIRRSNKDSEYVVSRGNVRSGKIEDVFSFGSMNSWQFFRDKDDLYIECAWYDEETGSYSMKHTKINLRRGKAEDLSIDFGIGKEEAAGIFAVSDGYVYFGKKEDVYGDYYGLYRVPVKGGKIEEIAALNSGFRFRTAVVDGGDIYLIGNGYIERREISSGNTKDYNLPTGEIRTTPNFSGGTAYYLKNDGIYSYGASEDGNFSETKMFEGDCSGFAGVGVSGSWLYLIDRDTDAFRVRMDARIIPRAPIVEEADRKNVDDALKFEDWEYFEYDKIIQIVDYVGDKTEITVPSKINGKPVRIVGLKWVYDTEKKITSVTVPEGIVSLNVLYGDNIKTVKLPKSLEFMSSRGYPYVFETADGATIEYAGTKAEWQELCDSCDKDLAIDHSGARNLTVKCSNGVWTEATDNVTSGN